jgi:transposase
MKEIGTKRLKKVNEKTLLATVDIGKTTNIGYARCPNRKEIKPFEFFNNGQGFKKFWDRIIQAKEANHLEAIVVGFESTGSYGEPLQHFLMKRSATLVQVNPLHTKRLKELQGNSPNKTDRKDPKVIADIIELGHALTVVIPEGVAAELRRLTQARERATQRRTRFFNQIQDLVFIFFPEFLQVMKDIKTCSARYLLRHYPCPEDIVRCGFENLGSILKKISRGKLDKKRAWTLYGAAGHSVGLQEGRKAILIELQEILSEMESVDQFILKIEQEMAVRLPEIPYSHSILSLKGIGVVTAAGLIGEVGDFGKFHTLSEILKLAGLDLFEVSSGQHKGNRHISKRGRSLLRKILFFAALNTVRKDGVLYDTYQRHLGKGMPPIKALVAVERKLLGILFALARDHSNYIVGYSKMPSLKKAA